VRPVRGATHPAFGPVTLLAVELLTGRTHQIRVHLAHVGFPLLGDDKYGDFILNKLLDKTAHKRMFLHAFAMSFAHPAEARPLRIEAPLPPAFRRLLDECDAPV
jgi:23S rRNA pseudouridine955/2504/2580 synthase